jgi:hypothetical protein
MEQCVLNWCTQHQAKTLIQKCIDNEQQYSVCAWPTSDVKKVYTVGIYVYPKKVVH